MFKFITNTWRKLTVQPKDTSFFEDKQRQEKQKAFDEMMKRKEALYPKIGQKWKPIRKELVAKTDPFAENYDTYFVEIVDVKLGWVKYTPRMERFSLEDASMKISTFTAIFEKIEQS